MLFLLAGMDEDAHWLVCKDEFREKCKHVMPADVIELGFEKRGSVSNIGAHNTIQELWHSNSNSSEVPKGLLS